MSFNIEFAATCDTKFGQRACICGNLPQLGAWNPALGLLLDTTPAKYPLWLSRAPLPVPHGITVEFKLCVVDSNNALVRWEQIGGNRIFSPRESLVIELTQSDPSMLYSSTRGNSSQSVVLKNYRKGTEDVINELGSDSSSNRDMWKEHDLHEDEGSLLLTQFTTELKKAVASQRQEAGCTLSYSSQLETHNQVEFGDCRHHFYNTHYFHSPTPINYCQPAYQEGEQITYIPDSHLDKFDILRRQEVSVFHLIGWQAQDLPSRVKRLRNRWTHISAQRERGLILVYLEESATQETVGELIAQGTDVVVCKDYGILRSVMEGAAGVGLSVRSGERDEFVVSLGVGRLMKMVYLPFSSGPFLQNVEDNLWAVKDRILNGFYFGFDSAEFEGKLRETLSLFKLSKNYCLMVVQLRSLDDLSAKTINELVHLPSLRHKIMVFVVTREKFPKNIKHKLSVSKNKMIFLNTFGEVFANNNDILNIFYYLEVTKQKFHENQQIVSKNLGEAVRVRKLNEMEVVLEFGGDVLGSLMKERALKCVRDVNRKSIAKLTAEMDEEGLRLVPFCLHPSFLMKVILKTFSLRLRSNEKGLVINMDTYDLKSVRYLETPEGRELKMKFLKFYLQPAVHNSYSCNPLTELQLHKLVQIISEEIEEDTKYHTPNKQEDNRKVYSHIKPYS